LNCGEPFEIERARLGRAKYCSLKCKDEYWSTTLSKTPENIERLRNHGIKTKKEQNNKFTKPERIVLEFLQKKEILFLPQFPMYDMFVVDFFLPDQNLVIEVLGDYWHGNPIKYKVPNDMQKKHQDRDSFKEKTLLEKGHKVLMIWETDIYKNIEDALNVLN
jgi:very-short-patch-repair endonuclease